MSKEPEGSTTLIDTLKTFISNNNLGPVEASINDKTQTVTIAGERDDYLYNVTIRKKVIEPISFIDESDTVAAVKTYLAAGYSQRDIAALLGISQSKVSRLSKL